MILPYQVLRAFVDQHRDRLGVESICRVLQIARPVTAGMRRSSLTPNYVDALIPEIQRVWDTNMQRYGAMKFWKQLRREGTGVARCTVERLMCRAGLQGIRRGQVVRTTVPGDTSLCPLDRVQRQFHADPAMGVGLHLCLDLARLAVRGLRD